MDHFDLNVERQTGRQAIYIKLVGGPPLGFEEKQVSWFIGESDEFILDTRAIPRADPFNFPAVHRGLVEIATNNVGRLGGGVGHPARNLFESGLPA